MSTMIRGQADPFAEHVSVMKALYQEYQKRDEAEDIAFIKAMYQEAQKTCAQQSETVKGIIRDLTKQADEAEVLAVYPEPEGFHQKRIAMLQAEVQQAQNAVQQLQADSRSLEEERTLLSAKVQELASKSKALDKAVASEEPLLRNQLSLYAHIAKVTWRLDQDSRIAGTVSRPGSGDIQSFDMDANALNEYERVNRMWELL